MSSSEGFLPSGSKMWISSEEPTLPAAFASFFVLFSPVLIHAVSKVRTWFPTSLFWVASSIAAPSLLKISQIQDQLFLLQWSLTQVHTPCFFKIFSSWSPDISIMNLLPQGSTGEEFVCQCRRWGFHPWVDKIPWKKNWQISPIFLPEKSHG